MIIYRVDWRAGDDTADRDFYVSAKNSSAALWHATRMIFGYDAYAYAVRVTALGDYKGQAPS